MKVVFTSQDIIEHFDSLDEKADSVFIARCIHHVAFIALSALVGFTVCSLTGKILIPSICALLFAIFFPRLLFLFLPSCKYPLFPTPKAFFFKALKDGKVLRIDVEGYKKCLITVFMINNNGQKEKRFFEMDAKIVKDLEEEVLNFDEGFVYLKKKTRKELKEEERMARETEKEDDGFGEVNEVGSEQLDFDDFRNEIEN